MSLQTEARLAGLDNPAPEDRLSPVCKLSTGWAKDKVEPGLFGGTMVIERDFSVSAFGMTKSMLKQAWSEQKAESDP